MKQIVMFMIQQSGAIRSFVDNIYTGKISTDDAGMDQNNL